MATITTDTYLDGGTARTAGETMAIGSGAKLTIRTDTRVHADAPTSFTGSLGNPTFTDIGGELYIDATAVRWLAYDSGGGNVPAIGTSITQSSVSGYLLGVWDTLASGPTAVGAAMPANGFIKLREVTNGPYTTGALGGITASATAADVAGWIECAWDSTVNFVVGRVGKIKSRGTWFYLDDTNGSIGQTIQVPSSSSAATDNFCPGVWVETAPSSDVYEFWPGLASAANGWVKTALGYAEGYTDARCKFVKAFGSGLVQFGETVTASATYASLAAQAGTYAGIALSSTYTWANNVVTVNTGSTAHLLENEQTIGLDFTSGDGVDAATFVVTVIDAYNFTCPYTGSGTGGNVTVRPGVTISFNSHGLHQGESVYCDFTTGTGTDGTYTVYSVDSANAYKVAYPHTASLTSGNVSCLHTLVVSATAHGHGLGNEVYCDFTSGGATDGRYVIKTVATNTFNINYAHTAAIGSSNVTLRWTVGSVPEDGCHVRISNIMMAECATASRATNKVPNSTIGSRPEFNTTTAGAIDLEYLYAWSLRSIFAQAYSVRLYHCAFMETLDISECATALDVDDIGVGMYSAQDARAFLLTSCFAGGTVKNIVACRATAGSSDHAAEALYCNGQTFTNITCGIIIYARNSGIAFNIGTCQNLTYNGLRVFNGNVPIATSVNITINDLDYNDRFIGHTNATTAYNALTVSSGCDEITLDGLTFGLGGTVEDCHPYTGILSVTAATNIKARNLGSSTAYLSTGVWAPNYSSMGVIFTSGGNNNTFKLQKAFVGKMRTGLISTLNSDKNCIYEQVLSSCPFYHSAKTVYTTTVASLNTDLKGMTTGTWVTSGQTSVYGTHWYDEFLGTGYGALILAMNEPTAETTSYYTNDAATALFNSSGGIEMRNIGAKSTWDTSYFIQGHTGFQNVTPVMSGGTIGNHRFKYSIDLNDGNGWSTLSAQYTGAELATELSGLTISATLGFKLRLQIETTSTNTAAITFLRFYTTTTTSAQNAIAYPLDPVTIQVTVQDAVTKAAIQGARVYLVAGADGPLSEGTLIMNTTTNASGIAQDTAFSFTANQPITGRARKGSSTPFYRTSDVVGTITSDGLTATVFLIEDE